MLATLHSLKADEMFFFIDELGPLQVKRYGGRCYTPKNKTPTHPQSQHSKGSIIFHAALSATTNQVTWVYGNAKDTSGMIDLVELLFNEHHAKVETIHHLGCRLLAFVESVDGVGGRTQRRQPAHGEMVQ